MPCLSSSGKAPQGSQASSHAQLQAFLSLPSQLHSVNSDLPFDLGLCFHRTATYAFVTRSDYETLLNNSVCLTFLLAELEKHQFPA